MTKTQRNTIIRKTGRIATFCRSTDRVWIYENDKEAILEFCTKIRWALNGLEPNDIQVLMNNINNRLLNNFDLK